MIFLKNCMISFSTSLVSSDKVVDMGLRGLIPIFIR